MFKTNEYFDGNVKSIAFETNEGPATIGVMAVGKYEFSTSKKEFMTVTSGKMLVKLPDSDEWKEFNKNETFIVEANKKFNVEVNEETAYICFYK
ncbi:pyrimidine/purine nucleoside phosphorylase [Tepidibacter hydrothermalis]|uniref:Pyrimidine/purine nucleoside phosphorylase n=1 Tax=Tepidibacter hydrothermalis TaxID=3036126 RepID=A0ABY8EGT3_9FIRM|nr:pyrimidine/purine nucleoside phosphorylase [Tepidibacter hydrothermalis]WFD12156.1 pyrimidine/purine nucleoside phosphorylase [Tepidibacter hydrothermalis]